MVYIELVSRLQQFHLAPAMQRPNSTASTPLRWILKNALLKKEKKKRVQSLIQNHKRHEHSESA